MQRSCRDVESSLRKKGFLVGSTHHRYFTYHTMDGRRSEVYTSHSGKEISTSLLSTMARQCRLSKAQFLQLVDWPMAQEEYERILQEQGEL